MRIGTAILAFFGVAALVQAAPPAYRWVDADGVHYSDQPHPGAQQITLSQTQTYSSAQADVGPAAARTPPRAARDAGGEFHYDSCAVVQPAQDQMLIDVESAKISVQVEPAKRSGDRVVVSLDGRSIEPDNNEQQEFVISPVDRGTHTVAASVRGADGQTLCQSPALTFHVRQPQVRRPKVTPH